MRLLLEDLDLDVADAVHGDIDTVVDVETVAAETVAAEPAAVAAVDVVVAVHLDAVAVAVDVVVAAHLDVVDMDVDIYAVVVDCGVAETS